MHLLSKVLVVFKKKIFFHFTYPLISCIASTRYSLFYDPFVELIISAREAHEALEHFSSLHS